jgi:hypothetical protein
MPDFAACNFSLFPLLKGRHFETIEVIKAELQLVQNTLTEHNFQARNGAYTWKRTTLKAIVASRHKVSFD